MTDIAGQVTGRTKDLAQRGDEPSGTRRGRRLPAQESVDVGVDLQTAYDQFTRFEDWPQTIGVVTFHRLSDNLTRIQITLDFQPKGLFEKAVSGMRISRRALKSDLMRFKAFIEPRDEDEDLEEDDEPAPPRPRRRRAAASFKGRAS